MCCWHQWAWAAPAMRWVQEIRGRCRWRHRALRVQAKDTAATASVPGIFKAYKVLPLFICLGAAQPAGFGVCECTAALQMAHPRLGKDG